MERGDNGGFPEPLVGEPVRLVRCEHEACGSATRVRLPREQPATAVRRVVCDGCHETFECERVLDVGVLELAPRSPALERRPGVVVKPRRDRRARGPTRWRAPHWLSDPQSHAWRYLSVPIAAAVVIGVLLLIQGSGGSTRHSASSAASAALEPARGGGANARSAGGAASAPADAHVVQGSSYTLALPPGWKRTTPKPGATFAARAQDGGADATLWIRRDPKLSFPAFEANSLAQLHQLAGNARVVNRVAAPTAEGMVVTLAADASAGQPSYEVTLRAEGPYRYYLTTTVRPNASREASDGIQLIHNSFLPTPSGGSGR